MRWSAATWFIPEEAIPVVSMLLLVVGGFLMIVQARRLASAAIILGLALPFTPLLAPIAEELVNRLPPAVVLLLLVGLALAFVGGLMRLLLGRRIAEEVIAHLIVAFILSVLRAPFRGIAFLVRLFSQPRV